MEDNRGVLPKIKQKKPFKKSETFPKRFQETLKMVGRLHNTEITDKTAEENVFSNPESAIFKDLSRSKEIFNDNRRTKGATKRTISLDLTTLKRNENNVLPKRKTSFQIQLNDNVIHEILAKQDPNTDDIQHKDLTPSHVVDSPHPPKSAGCDIQQEQPEPDLDSIPDINVMRDDTCSAQSLDRVDESCVDLNYLFVNSYDIGTPKTFDSRSLSSCSFVSESGSPSKEPIPLSRKFSDGNTSGDENLEEARNRMHKLLDDAFSLISPRSSFSENDLRKGTSTSNDEKSTNSRQSSTNVVDVDKAIETLKGFTNPAYTSSYSGLLETWSPYRASDQVALISMPQKPEPVVTRLGYKPDKRPLTSNKAANYVRRPAANLDVTNSKSTSDISESGKYTTNAPKPIVIRTKDDIPNARLESAKSEKNSNELQNKRNVSAVLNNDLLLRGSSTSLNKPTSQAKSNSLEMQHVKRNRSNSIRKHREPEKDNRNRDEIDVIKNIKPEEASDKLFQSLRDEIKGGKAAETEDDINKKPIRRRNRKTHSKPMTDIV